MVIRAGRRVVECAVWLAGAGRGHWPGLDTVGVRPPAAAAIMSYVDLPALPAAPGSGGGKQGAPP